MSLVSKVTYGLVHALLGPAAVAELRARRTVARVDRGDFEDSPGMRVISSFVKSGDICVDIGASYGRFAYDLALAASPGPVHAVEPTPLSAAALRRIASRSGIDNLSVHELAIGGAEGKETMLVPGRVNQRAFLQPAAPEESPFDIGDADHVEVRVTTLDRFVEAEGLLRLDFMKCDVEGAELEIFRGGSSTLRRFTPVIWCEIEDRHTRKYGHTAQDVFDYVRGLGYAPHVLSGEWSPQPIDSPTPTVNDYLLLPR